MKNLFYTSPKYLQNLKGINSSAREIDDSVLYFKQNRRIYARDFGIKNTLTLDDNVYEEYNNLIEYVNGKGGAVDVIFDKNTTIHLDEIVDYTLPIAEIKRIKYIQVPNTRWYFNGSSIITKGDYHKTLGGGVKTPKASLAPLVLWEADFTEIHDVTVDGMSYQTTKDDTVFPEWPYIDGKYEFRTGTGIYVISSKKVVIRNCETKNNTIDGIYISSGTGRGYLTEIKELSGKESDGCMIIGCMSEYNSRGGIVLTSCKNTLIDSCTLENNGKSREGGYGGVAVMSNLNFEFDANAVPIKGYHQTNLRVINLISKYPALKHVSGGEAQRKTYGASFYGCTFVGAGEINSMLPNTTYSHCEFDDGILRDGVRDGVQKLVLSGTPEINGRNRTKYLIDNCKWHYGASPFITFSTTSTNKNTIDTTRILDCEFSLVADHDNIPATAPKLFPILFETSVVDTNIIMDRTVCYYDPRFLKNLPNGGSAVSTDLFPSIVGFDGCTYGEIAYRWFDIKGINKDYFITNPNAWLKIDPRPHERYTYSPNMSTIASRVDFDTVLTYGAKSTKTISYGQESATYYHDPIKIIDTNDAGKILVAGQNIATINLDNNANSGLVYNANLFYYGTTSNLAGTATIVGTNGTGKQFILNDANSTISSLFDITLSGNFDTYKINIAAKSSMTIGTKDNLILDVKSINYNFVIEKMI